MTKKSNLRLFALFVLPTLVCYLVLFVLPLVLGVALSFCRFSTVENASFVGLENYRAALTGDDGFLRSMLFGLGFSLASVVLVNLVALGLALLLTRKIRGATVLRAVFFMPNLIGGIVLGYVWNLLVNGILSNFGVDITFRAAYGFFGLLTLNVWQLGGYMAVIYIAALLAVPNETIEASRIDGAGAWQSLVYIKLPLILPSILICAFLTFTNAFKMFDQNLALTGGAPEGETMLPALNIFNTFYGRAGAQGVGQAKAVIFFIIVALLGYLQLKQGKENENGTSKKRTRVGRAIQRRG